MGPVPFRPPPLRGEASKRKEKLKFSKIRRGLANDDSGLDYAASEESDECLVASAVFKTVVGMSPCRGWFDSFPLRHAAVPFPSRPRIPMSREEILKLTSMSSAAG